MDHKWSLESEAKLCVFFPPILLFLEPLLMAFSPLKNVPFFIVVVRKTTIVPTMHLGFKRDE